MTDTYLHRDNHYVPRMYLKRFEATPGRVLTYRTLVAHDSVPLWKPQPVARVAHQFNLYTRMAAGKESDEVERWLDREFESPAEEAIGKATSGARMTDGDWERLIRFTAAQDVRTPARLIENIQRWEKSLPRLLDKTMRDAVRRLERAKEAGTTVSRPEVPNTDYLPIRVTTAIAPGEKFGTVKAEVSPGRGLWLFGIRHLLSKTIRVLMQQRWTILKPHDGLAWFTSDDPVIRLNYYEPGKYDFKGGWGNPKTEILLPLDPFHLLYTMVGERPPQRGTTISLDQTKAIRRFIAEHAHRVIIASTPDVEVPVLHPRTVDAGLVRHEREEWRQWHDRQSAAEKEATNSRP